MKLMSSKKKEKTSNNKPKRCPCGKADRFSRCIACNPKCACPDHPEKLKERCNICKVRQCKKHPENRSDRCNECRPDRGCIHKSDKLQCGICNPDRLCKVEGHTGLAASCRRCGKRRCEHDTDKDRCRACTPLAFCVCNREKSTCVKCQGSGICKETNKRKSICLHCNGGYLCKHGKQKQECYDCDGANYCACKKQKKYCPIHGGNALCVLCRDNYGRKKFQMHCDQCFKLKFPDEYKKIVKISKHKENEVVLRIRQRFPNLTITHDKIITGSGLLYRPDVLIETGSGKHKIIVEIDEHKHSSYGDKNEEKRTNDIVKKIQPQKLVMIRFNPDSYINGFGERIPSCWAFVHKGFGIKEQEDWEYRMECLFNEIEYHINNCPEKQLTVVPLFYNQKRIDDNDEEINII